MHCSLTRGGCKNPPPQQTSKGKMRVLIVGHGPGLKGRGQGKKIDSFDNVVRFGDSGYWQTSNDYGTKTDYILSVDQRVADLINVGRVPKETWVYGRPGFRDEPFIMERLKGYNPYICKVTDEWLERFKELGATGYCTERCSEPFFSQGMAAIIMACDRLKAKKLYLPGFDALLSGTSENYEAGTNKGKVITSEHDFAAEKKLLTEVLKHYQCEVMEWG